jgi:hypothetical protein
VRQTARERTERTSAAAVLQWATRYQRLFVDDPSIEYPLGSGQRLTYGQVTADLRTA